MLKLTAEFAFPAGSLLCAALSAVYDVRSRRIPNFITLPAIAFGLLLHAVFGGWRQVETYDSGSITVWSKDDAPPARTIPSDAIA